MVNRVADARLQIYDCRKLEEASKGYWDDELLARCRFEPFDVGRKSFRIPGDHIRGQPNRFWSGGVGKIERAGCHSRQKSMLRDDDMPREIGVSRSIRPSMAQSP
jgi:hypothetical protein